MRVAVPAALAAILPLAAFDAVVLLLAPPSAPVIWLSLLVLHLGVLASVFAPAGGPGGSERAVFGYPLLYLVGLFVVVQFVFASLLIFNSDLARSAEDSPTFPLALQIVLCAVFAAAYLGPASVAGVVDQRVSTEADERAWVRTASGSLRTYGGRASDPDIRAKVRRLEEDIRYGPVQSLPALADLERRILVEIDDLAWVDDRDLAIRRLEILSDLVAQRRETIRLSH